MDVQTVLSFIIVLLVTVNIDTQGFITHDDCPAPSQCRCYSFFISCANRHLTRVPAFGNTFWTQDKLILSFPGNELTTLQTYAFRGLRFRHRTKVELLLNINRLNSIEPNAFSGLTGKVVHINLNDNNFTSIPTELSLLTTLQELELLRNPILSLDDATLASLGIHLRSFQISLQYFKTWPTEMRHLENLKELSIFYLYFQYLDQNSFDGMNSLTTVQIDNSSLVSIPVSLTKLPFLTSFTISRSNNLSLSEAKLKPCLSNTMNTTRASDLIGTDFIRNNSDTDKCLMATSTNVEISHNNLRYLDDIFSIFPSVTNLSLAYNNISFIYSDDVKDNMSLVDLDISHNNLTRVPSALNKANSLIRLNLQYNRIVSVEDFDLFGLVNLKMLSLAHNPLEYIAPNAFENNLMLSMISLSDTHLRFLPVSLSGLKDLQSLYLPYGYVECTCKMASLKFWNVNSRTISGYCKNRNVSIKAFIENELLNCK